MHDGTLLAIDSSTDVLALAACGRRGSAHAVQAGGAQASARVIDDCRTLLAEMGECFSTLDAIAFGRGPGAFTGLRTACAVAQGLAWGIDRPVLSIDSLMQVAEAAWPWSADSAPRPLAVVLDARMGEVYAARYAHGPAGWTVVEAPRLHTPHALWAAWQAEAPAAWTGSGLVLMPEPTALPAVTTVDAARAEALLRLAQAAWRRGETLSPRDAVPVYVRDKVASTTAEREAAARAAPA